MLVVSIIIPIYNVGPYILKCLQSVANQTVTDGLECILVDDCGTDNSMRITEQFVTRYNGTINFKILHHEQNRGLSAARNTGVQAAKGDYVYFLDSDDTITHDCMAEYLKIIEEHPEVDLIQGLIDQDSAYMNQFTTKKFPKYTEDRKYIKKALLDYDMLPICAANKMVRRRLIIENNLFFKEGIIHEDNYWSFFLAKHVKSLAVYPKKCYLYTVNPESITKAVNRGKEIYSAKIIVEDFCNNIDNFLMGEQKITILNYLNRIFSNKYYEDENQKDMLFGFLYYKCNVFEKTPLYVWYTGCSSGTFGNKIFNICIRLFKILN